MVFHESHEASDRKVKISRGLADSLPGRHHHISPVRTDSGAHLSWAINLLQELGFIINQSKTILSPTQTIEFLGFKINSVACQLRLPNGKMRAIKKELQATLAREMISLRSLARIVRLLASSIQSIFPGPFNYRALQRLKIRHLRTGL